MKIAISGKICSGKSTLAKQLAEHCNGVVISFASRIKELAVELFGMTVKDRRLLIDIGMKMKEIDDDVWINCGINRSKEHKYVFIDDLRFPNEYLRLKEEGFVLVRLNISPEEQLRRLKETYPDTWEEHQKKLDDITEISLDNYEFDYTFDENTSAYENLIKFIQ